MITKPQLDLLIQQWRELSSGAPSLVDEAKKQGLLEEALKDWPLRRRRPTNLLELYEQVIAHSDNSCIYTPKELAQELYEQTPKRPGGRILDCSAGCGALAAPFYEAGWDPLLLDEDRNALFLARTAMPKARTQCGNFLTHEAHYDIIIGNPPYKGHKTMTMEEKRQLKQDFPEVMTDKMDFFAAFFAKAHALLNEGGILSFLVSRYWLEAESARGLRAFILNQFRILYLHDWYGERPFGAGIDPLIIVLQKENPPREYSFPAKRGPGSPFVVSRSDLSPDQMTPLTPKERRLRSLMEAEGALTLGRAGTFHQGIITGLDRAFIVSAQQVQEAGLEEELLVPWMKSKDLRSGPPKDQWLIYAQANAQEHPQFMKWIQAFRERLSKRREVQNGVRAYYELQWGRNRDLFERERLCFVYKAPQCFFKKVQGVYHSADVYSYESSLDLDWLSRLLNHPLYDAYVKTHLKKLGRDLYEFYPHRLKNIWIPDPTLEEDPEAFCRRIESLWQTD
ncbi:hypothetical protein ABB02_02014 [Clostridiaceae bacterium JG1575]|nr:hypothetical protein ABB02_02014 [Clostridiaceae bacterium JG1575]